MKIILVFVSTVDGKVTKWGDPDVKSWSSQEDKVHFRKTWKTSKLIVMGSNTFEAEQILASPNHLLVIMTGNPVKYKKQEVSGQLEFTDESPVQLAVRFDKEGFKQMTVVGGAHVATSFLKAQLIDELWLTIEPYLFGTGGNLVIEEMLDIELNLISCDRVNEQGTLIVKYTVVKK